MKFPTKLIGLLLFVAILSNCSSPSDSENNELKQGKFELTTSGIFEDNLSGDATFNLYENELYPKQFFQLNLKAGEIPFVPDSLSDGHGLFVDLEWDSSKTLKLTDNTFSVYITRSSYFPYFPHPLSSGNIYIESQSKDLITGEINITDTLAYPDSGAINITGRFSAIKAE